jgi:hypothetical protein
MMTISKQDVFKTVMIVWFIGATGYVIYDTYIGYKVRGMQAAYNAGYSTSVNDLIGKVSSSNCQPIEIKKDNVDIKLIDYSCSQKQAQSDQSQPSGGAMPTINSNSTAKMPAK